MHGSDGSKGGPRDAPPGVQILSISCSFWENLANSYVGAPLGSWRPLLGEILDPLLHGEEYLHRDSMKYEDFGSRVLHSITRLFRTLQRQIICNKLDIDVTILIRTCVICKIKTTFLIRITCAIYVFHL